MVRQWSDNGETMVRQWSDDGQKMVRHLYLYRLEVGTVVQSIAILDLDIQFGGLWFGRQMSHTKFLSDR